MAGCESQAAVPQSDWKLLKGQLAAAMAEVDRAVEMARDDAKLAQQAYTQIAAAERAVQTARGFCQSGVTADCSAAAALAERARSELARQDYERALQSADQAERMARDASNQAAARARELESRLALERQRREQQNWSNLGTLVAVASSLAQAGQGVRGASNMGAGGTGPRPAPPAPSPSPTSQTGWSSNTSRSKW
jgi:tetratricopeptide (TPR) repeat protein